jgi:hypothetical protein
MGNGLKSLPVSFRIFTVANLRLCGIPFIRGFYSKDLILEDRHSYHFCQVQFAFISPPRAKSSSEDTHTTLLLIVSLKLVCPVRSHTVLSFPCQFTGSSPHSHASSSIRSEPRTRRTCIYMYVVQDVRKWRHLRRHALHLYLMTLPLTRAGGRREHWSGRETVAVVVQSVQCSLRSLCSLLPYQVH